jgi:cytosine/adenosine deaminase-related metal-dependent hydrolase
MTDERGTRRWLAELAWLPGQGVCRDVLIEAEGERFTSVTPDNPSGPGPERLVGLTLPGFANAHSHAFHRALRGVTQAGRGTFWTWRERMYEVAGRLDPDTYLALARAVYAEMALAGISCVGEFHYLHHRPDGCPYADPNAMGRALIQAAAEALLQAATAAGHASLGWPDAGEIVSGAHADLVTVSLDSLRTAGTTSDLALEAAVFAASSTDIRSVVISGRDVVRDGVHQLVPDVPAELARTIRAALG